MTTGTDLAPVEAPLLAADGVRHGFFTRHGGVSGGIYRGLNAGTGSSDDPAAVAENRRRIAGWLNVEPAHLISPWQVHSPDTVTVSAPFGAERPKADGIVTATPGMAVGVLTADCGPILFSDPNAGVVGAAHAGWKGALAGIAESTISAMEKLGAKRKDIKAVLGPSISKENYEVGPEFVDRFTASDKANAKWFTPSKRSGHSMFDLQGYTVARLARAGVESAMTGHCTYPEAGGFYSYRRTTHRAEPDYGRQISAITLET